MAASFLEVAALHPIAAVLACRETGEPLVGGAPDRRALRIGLSSSLSWGFLRELIRRARTAPESMSLSFQDGTPGEVLCAVRRGEVDVGFVPQAADVGRLNAEELWRERMMVALPEGHRLAAANELSASDLRQETFLVAGEPSDHDRQVGVIEQVIGGPPAVVKRLSVERDTLLNLVGLGFGLALTSGSAMGAFHPNVVYLPVANAQDHVTFRLVWKPENRNPQLGAFLATARALSARWAHDPVVAYHCR